MNRETVLEAIARAVPDVESVLSDLDPTIDFWRELQLDSMDRLSVLTRLAELTGIEIPDRDAARLTSVDAIVDYGAARNAAPDPRPGRSGAGIDGEWFEVGEGRMLEIRPTTVRDAELICEFYRPVSPGDRRRRFFTVFRPHIEWCREWASVGERGGFGAIAIVHDGDEQTVVAEAGYAIRDDGDGELAVMVAPDWRGWLGTYLVDVLARHAAAHGIANLEADVLLENRQMLAILRHRGAVDVEHSPGVVRVTIGTSGDLPSWPPAAEGHKVLVAVRGGRWAGEHAAEAAGWTTAMCSGPERPGGCPVLEGGRCPLADEAEAIVVLLDPDDERTQRLIELHRTRRPGVPVFVVPSSDEPETVPDGCAAISTSADETVAHIMSLIGSAPGDDAVERTGR